MDQYLVTLAIGPVQGFIAAARRSRDLWYGSYLLSEVSKAAARCLKDNGATLIFPPDNSSLVAAGNPERQVSNKILASVATDTPDKLIAEIKEAAREAWTQEAQKVWNTLASAKRREKLPINKALWEAQCQDLLELFAAWSPLPDGNEAYKKSYDNLECLLAARKNTRDFLPNANQDFGFDKSSLDALRESVLPPKRNRSSIFLKRWGIGESEELDCPGLVKRVGGKLSLREGIKRRPLEHFTPLSRIAIDPWIRHITGNPPNKNTSAIKKPCDLRDYLEPLIHDDLVSRVCGNGGIYNDFRYDGQLLYPFRLEAEKNRLKIDKEHAFKIANVSRVSEIERTEKLLNNLQVGLEALWNQYGQPNPYLAILRADGDSMGQLLSNKDNADLPRHQAISTSLAAFAQTAQQCIREKYQGHAIYTGGDDVLALLPQDKAIACANELRRDFQVAIKPFAGTDNGTLSVGLAIGHFLEPLPVLLDMAGRAQQLAKDGVLNKTGRNALGIILKPRSGGEVAVWSSWATEPMQRLQYWITAFRNGLLPMRTPYLLHAAQGQLNHLQNNRTRYENALNAMVIRIIDRRAGGNSAEQEDELEKLRAALLDTATDNSSQCGLEGLVNELLLAKRLAIIEDSDA